MSEHPRDNVESFDFERAYKRALRHTASGRKDHGAEAEGIVQKPSSLLVHGSTETLCKDIADILVRRYPDWSWAIQPQEFGGVINIYNFHLHNQYGFTLKMDDLSNPRPRKRLVERAGHEILRRFRMPDRMRMDVLAEAPRDIAGNCIPDISDIASKKERQNAEIALGLATGRLEHVTDAQGHQYLKVNW